MKNQSTRLTSKKLSLEEKLVQTILIFGMPQKIFLFGSRARGDSSERADYDIAVDWPGVDNITRAKVFDAIDDISTLSSIDLVWLDTSSEFIKKRILQEGKVLYESES